MIRKLELGDREAMDGLMMELQKYFTEVDTTCESKEFPSLRAAHDYMEKMLDDVEKMNGAVYVLEQEGEVIGFVQGVIIDRTEVKDGTDYAMTHKLEKQGWIGLLVVTERYRGKGFGQELLDGIVNYFESEGCDCIKLLTLYDNKHAIEFYERNGFAAREVEMVKRVRA